MQPIEYNCFQVCIRHLYVQKMLQGPRTTSCYRLCLRLTEITRLFKKKIHVLPLIADVTWMSYFIEVTCVGKDVNWSWESWWWCDNVSVPDNRLGGRCLGCYLFYTLYHHFFHHNRNNRIFEGFMWFVCIMWCYNALSVILVTEAMMFSISARTNIIEPSIT